MLPEVVKKDLSQGIWGRVSIPVKDEFPLTLNALIRIEVFPVLEVEFGADQLPCGFTGDGGEWVVLLNSGTDMVSLYARLETAINPRHFRLQITKSQYHTQTRNHPRVKTEIYLRFRREGEKGFNPAIPVRKKVDISRSGLRFVDSSPFVLDEILHLEISLPGIYLQVVECDGKVVRVEKKSDGCREIGLRFSEISVADAEKVNAFCMACQFQQMTGRAAGLLNVSPQLLIPDKPLLPV